MVGRLRVNEFMVLTPGGVPIFHFSPNGSRRLDELLSGFLTAITSFATEFGERTVQSLSFEGSEILYEQSENEMLFIFLVGTHAPNKTLRIVLRDLSRKFITRYETELEKEVVIEESFLGFELEVRDAFDFYESVLGITSNLSAYVVPTLNEEAFTRVTERAAFLDEFHRDFGFDGTRILEAIDGKSSIENLSLKLGLEDKDVQEVIEYLTIWGVLKIAQMCPQFGGDDARFDAFLDLIGLPNKDYQLLQRARPLCTGTRSVVDISERLGVTSERLFEVLIKIGDEVKWNLVEVAGLSESLRPRY